MSPFVFLLIPVVIVVLASLVMWLRGRQPQTLNSGIHGFRREMDALSPGAASPRPRRFDAEGGPDAPDAPSPAPGPGRDA
ncbi:MAG TPA: hypothetical protein VEW93_11670 [Acidimicrobiales bacterium]|nr:hypothetical protein [Acidimicrobiales bacterium]